ncbi:MAG TPA: protein-disulfide reductase [Desulfonatronum sp.]|nr:protein-disulfide reductase [Desulfonatronum sp.]
MTTNFSARNASAHSAKASSRAPVTRLFLAVAAAILLCGSVVASSVPTQAQTASPPYSSTLELIRLEDGLGSAPAGSLLGLYWITPDPGWYTYSHQPGSTGIPTTMQAMLAPGEKYLQVYYPPGIVKEDSLEPGTMVEAFVEPTPIFLVLPGEMHPEDILHLRLRMLFCSERSCWPVDSREEFTFGQLQSLVTVFGHDQSRDTQWSKVFLNASPGSTKTPFARPAIPDQGLAAEAETIISTLEPISFQPGLEVRGLGKALALALLGGLILNLMPCVLPVISLKLRGLIPDPEAAAGDLAGQRKAFRNHNQLFALGILTFFLFLSFLLSLTGMVWGQLFQNPTTVIVLATLLLALGLSLFGVFNLPVIDLKLGRKGQSSMSAEGQAYFTGILATLLATPCSGPFLGGVLAWSLVQPPLVVAGVFLCVGLGMASPYFMLSFFPSLVRFLPKPGNWTLHLEKILGFLLVATCIYLLTFLPPEFLFPVLVLFWFTGLAAWIWGSWTTLSQSALRRWSIRLLAVALVVIVGAWTLSSRPVVSDWEAYSDELFAEILGQDRMLVDFTADWCPNCKFLEKTVLTPENLATLQQAYGVRLIKVDLTHEHAPGIDLLRGLGTQSIPMVAIFERGHASRSPLILRDLFTMGQLEQAMAQAFQEQ